MYLVKYDPAGKVAWATMATGDYNNVGNSVCTDLAGNIFVAGRFGNHNLGGSITFDTITLHSKGGRDLFLAKYDPDGQALWARRAGSPTVGKQDFAWGVAADADGNAVIGGWFNDTTDFDGRLLLSAGKRDAFVAKYSGAGQLLWANRCGGPENDNIGGVQTDGANNIYVTGHFTGTADFGPYQMNDRGNGDIFVAKYTPDGRVLWVIQMGGGSELPTDDVGLGLSTNPQGESVITGSFSGTMRIGDEVLVSAGSQDVFIVILDTNGNVLQKTSTPIIP